MISLNPSSIPNAAVGVDRTVVLHSVSVWLPQTCTWIHTQVNRLPGPIESHVACEAVRNLDQFPHPRIHPLFADRSRYRRDSILRGLRVRRHLDSLTRVAKDIRADVLHTHFGHHGWANARAAKSAGLKHVVTFYGVDVSHLPHRDSRWVSRYQEMFGLLDRVLCEGPHMAAAVRDLGCPAEKVLVQHLGVDPSEIPFEPRVLHLGEPLRVLIAATFREKKGIPVALNALGKVAREIQVEITVIGDAADPERDIPEKERIIAALSRNHLEHRTRLLGFIPYRELLREASRHHVFLSPSQTAANGDTEGGAPVSLIDMAASGMLIVSTRHCDIPELVLDGVTGLLADEKDVDALAAHLLWLYRHPDSWLGLQAAGRHRVETDFNASVQAERLTNIYEECLVG